MQILFAHGWTDAIRKLYPEEIVYTFFGGFRNAYHRNAGLRIDHLLLSQTPGSQLMAAGVNPNVQGWEKLAIMPWYGLSLLVTDVQGTQTATGMRPFSRQLKTCTGQCFL